MLCWSLPAVCCPLVMYCFRPPANACPYTASFWPWYRFVAGHCAAAAMMPMPVIRLCLLSGAREGEQQDTSFHFLDPLLVCLPPAPPPSPLSLQGPLPGATRGGAARQRVADHPGAALRHRAQLRSQDGGGHEGAAATPPGRQCESQGVPRRGGRQVDPGGGRGGLVQHVFPAAWAGEREGQGDIVGLACV